MLTARHPGSSTAPTPPFPVTVPRGLLRCRRPGAGTSRPRTLRPRRRAKGACEAPAERAAREPQSRRRISAGSWPPTDPLDVAAALRRRARDDGTWLGLTASDDSPASADLRRRLGERQAAWRHAAALLARQWRVVDALADLAHRTQSAGGPVYATAADELVSDPLAHGARRGRRSLNGAAGAVGGERRRRGDTPPCARGIARWARHSRYSGGRAVCGGAGYSAAVQLSPRLYEGAWPPGAAYPRGPRATDQRGSFAPARRGAGRAS